MDLFAAKMPEIRCVVKLSKRDSFILFFNNNMSINTLLGIFEAIVCLTRDGC